jgi:hypothetical protein
MNKRALVTLVIGSSFQETFKTWFLPGWTAYCSRHGHDLIVIDAPQDDSPRARSRSPAWQKCLVYRHPAVSRYEQVAWVDADIRIRPDAPDLFAGIPPEVIGAVNEYATPTPEDYANGLAQLYRRWDAEGTAYINNLTPRDYHRNFGIDSPHDGVVQTGVIAFSPGIHGRVFQETYDQYEEKGDPSWCYEMRPLSHEIQQSGALQWISPKFNLGWSLCELLYYPFLTRHRSRLRKLLALLTGNAAVRLRRKCVTAAFESNYFLHFAGRSPDYRLIPPSSHAA